MSPTRSIYSLLLLLLWSATATGEGGAVGNGAPCNSDVDCFGNLDCIRTSVFRKHCFPVSCAKGAAQALLDDGFDAEAYMNSVRGNTGIRGTAEFLRDSGDNANTLLSEALRLNPPPMSVFQQNYTACLNPSTYVGSRQRPIESETFYGLMWSLAGVFSYFGKVSWFTRPTTQTQLLMNCVGFLVGADVGLDVLFQVFNEGADGGDNRLSPDMPENANSITINFNPGDAQFIPIFTVGPFGVQVGWFASAGPGKGTITEVTLGPSFGAALGGFSQCFNSLTVTST